MEATIVAVLKPEVPPSGQEVAFPRQEVLTHDQKSRPCKPAQEIAGLAHKLLREPAVVRGLLGDGKVVHEEAVGRAEVEVEDEVGPAHHRHHGRHHRKRPGWGPHQPRPPGQSQRQQPHPQDAQRGLHEQVQQGAEHRARPREAVAQVCGGRAQEAREPVPQGVVAEVGSMVAAQAQVPLPCGGREARGQ